jgi:uncharacterized protein (UPF0264 family)
MIRLLVSVRSVAEALIAARGGADFIDLKEPGQGALGGLPVETVGEIVAALRAEPISVPVSATIGDLLMTDLAAIRTQVEAIGACGVTYVKVGITAEPAAGAVLAWLAQCGWPVIPVFIADHGLNPALVAQALALGFPGVMADTADKLAGSLFDAVPLAELQAFVAQARSGGVMVGVAGALRVADAARLAALASDFVGFRSAVCVGDRAGALDPGRLSELVAAMKAAQSPDQLLKPLSIDRVSPSSSERTRAISAR